VNQWLDEFGDPRKGDIDPVVWVESIPFSETRNYVMRVLEGLHVYRARLTGIAAPVTLAADMPGELTPHRARPRPATAEPAVDLYGGL
jgi:soluble lytic murein transglycosylase